MTAEDIRGFFSVLQRQRLEICLRNVSPFKSGDTNYSLLSRREMVITVEMTRVATLGTVGKWLYCYEKEVEWGPL